MKRCNLNFAVLAVSAVLLSSSVSAADYKLDIKGMHAYIEFKVPHLGYSILSGRFNDFDGAFNWDKEKPEETNISVDINTTSLDSNHAKRDEHLTGAKYLNTEKHPTAKFVSTKYSGDDSGGELTGDFTLNGVTQSITLDVSVIGEGDDPWGGYRAGFTATTTLVSKDFGYTGRGFPAEVELELGVEGVRQ